MHHQVFEKETIDIHKIIDDAMAKGDRTVAIYIGEHGTSINVSPYSDEPLRWVRIEHGFKPFECPSCGNTKASPTTYCPDCGEKLAMPKD